MPRITEFIKKSNQPRQRYLKCTTCAGFAVTQNAMAKHFQRKYCPSIYHSLTATL